MTDNIDDLLKQRAQLKRQVTRKLNLLDRHRLYGETNLVEGALAEAMTAFSNFEMLCNRIIDIITDETEFEDAISYFIAVEAEHLERLAPTFTYLGYDSPRFTFPSPAVYAKHLPLPKRIPVPQVFDEMDSLGILPPERPLLTKCVKLPNSMELEPRNLGIVCTEMSRDERLCEIDNDNHEICLEVSHVILDTVSMTDITLLSNIIPLNYWSSLTQIYLPYYISETTLTILRDYICETFPYSIKVE